MIGVDLLVGIALIVAVLLCCMVLMKRAAWRCPVCPYSTLRRTNRAAHIYAHMVPPPPHAAEERKQH